MASAVLGHPTAAQESESLPFRIGEHLEYRVNVSRVKASGRSSMSVDGPVDVRGTSTYVLRFDFKAVLGPFKAIDAVAVTIAADKLDCRNGTMNGHMLKAIKATVHPTITFTLASYELARVAENLQVEMNGTLTLGGTARDVIVTATATASRGPDGALQIVGAHALSMKDFGLKPPCSVDAGSLHPTC